MNASEENSLHAILDDFKKVLTEKEQREFEITTLNDVRETALQIQNDRVMLKNMMNMRRLELFLEAMNQFEEVLELFTDANIFAAFVWGPLKFILQTISTWADSFEHILDAYYQIGEHMPLLKQYETVFIENNHMCRVFAFIYAEILEFHKKALLMFQGRNQLWRRLFRYDWKDFQNTFEELLRQLTQQRQLIAEQALLLRHENSQSGDHAVLALFQRYEQDRSDALNQLRKREEADKDIKHRKLLQWFSAAQTTPMDHEEYRAIRSLNKRSGQWILQNEKIQDWMETDVPVSSILWVNGIPFAGKTILTSVIVDSCMQNKLYTTSYFYCNRNDPEKNDIISIYRGLLSQLMNQYRELIPYCYDKYVSSGEVSLCSIELAEQLLKTFLEKISKHFIIIDGLDECHSAKRKLLLKFLNSTVNEYDDRTGEVLGTLRVLLVSQNFPDIATALQTASILTITMEDNKNDIKSFVHELSKKIREKFSLSTQQAEFIEDSTCIRAQGMFLFAKLVMENLLAQGTLHSLDYELEKYPFPDGLGDAYERILKSPERRLNSRQWAITRKLLGWMACAKRPFTWREIQAAISMDLEEQTIDIDRKRLRGSIEEYCGPLIQVFSGDRVDWVHSTARIHIKASKRVRPILIECNLAALCLRYLTFECFDDEIDPDDLTSLATRGFMVFQDYAAAKWDKHIRAIVQSSISDFSTDPESQAALQDLDRGLDEFSSRYKEDIIQSPILPAAEEDCLPFKVYPFYQNLVQIWNHICQVDLKGPEARNKIGIKSLCGALLRNRAVIEELINSSHAEELRRFYGDRHFKCPRTDCFYFHEGFNDAKSRNQHVHRHEQPFTCTAPDCTIAEFGFSSNKDLQKHRKMFHFETTDQWEQETLHRLKAIDAPGPPATDSGYGSTGSAVHAKKDDEQDDARTVLTDNQDLDVPDDVKEKLIGAFSGELIRQIQGSWSYRNDRTLMWNTCAKLLKEFSLRLGINVSSAEQKKAVTFIRHFRK
ncbi:hypothetical protein V8E51_015541 [Hyaloscypha variabilis]